MRIGVAASIRIGDRHATHRRTCTLEHLSIIVAVEQRVLDIAIAMWPSIDSDRNDIARTRETACAQHAIELVANPRLEVVKGHLHERPLPGVELLARGKTAVG